MCTWLSPSDIPLSKKSTKIAFKKCGYRLKCQKKCSCRNESVSCLPICNCRGKCDVLWLKTHTFLYAFVFLYKLIFFGIDLNFISAYFTDCIYLYRQAQSYLLRGIEDGKKVLGLTVSVNLVICNFGIDFSNKYNFILYQIYSLFLMLIQISCDGQN